MTLIPSSFLVRVLRNQIPQKLRPTPAELFLRWLLVFTVLYFACHLLVFAVRSSS